MIGLERVFIIMVTSGVGSAQQQPSKKIKIKPQCRTIILFIPLLI